MDAVELIATQVTAGEGRTVHELDNRKFDKGTGWTYVTYCNRILFGYKTMLTTREATCEECSTSHRPGRPKRKGK